MRLRPAPVITKKRHKHASKIHRRKASPAESSMNSLQVAVKTAPVMTKAVIELTALIVGGLTGGMAGAFVEKDLISKRRGGLMSGFIGLLIGAPFGAVILTVLAYRCMA